MKKEPLIAVWLTPSPRLPLFLFLNVTFKGKHSPSILLNRSLPPLKFSDLICDYFLICSFCSTITSCDPFYTTMLVSCLPEIVYSQAATLFTTSLHVVAQVLLSYVCPDCPIENYIPCVPIPSALLYSPHQIALGTF